MEGVGDDRLKVLACIPNKPPAVWSNAYVSKTRREKKGKVTSALRSSPGPTRTRQVCMLGKVGWWGALVPPYPGRIWGCGLIRPDPSS